MNLSISRDGVEIGEWPEEEIRELYHEGKLLGTDYYWQEGMEEWKALKNLLKPPIPAKEKAHQKPPAKIKKEHPYAGLAIAAALLISFCYRNWNGITTLLSTGRISYETLGETFATIVAATGVIVLKYRLKYTWMKAIFLSGLILGLISVLSIIVLLNLGRPIQETDFHPIKMLSEDGHFSIDAPEPLIPGTYEQDGIVFHMYQTKVYSPGRQVFTIGYCSIDEAIPKSQLSSYAPTEDKIEEMTESASKGLVEEQKGILISNQEIQQSNLSGREMFFHPAKMPTALVDERVVLVWPRLYILSVISPYGNMATSETNDFFNSFQLIQSK